MSFTSFIKVFWYVHKVGVTVSSAGLSVKETKNRKMMANNQIPGSYTLTEWYMGEPFEQCTQHIIRVCAIKRVQLQPQEAWPRSGRVEQLVPSCA